MKYVLILLGILVLVGGCGVAVYNGIVSKDEGVQAAWSEIQNQYQRRAELIPSLVETVKGAAEFEQSTITAVTEARASVGRMSLPETVPQDPAQLEAYIKAQDQLGGALQRLLLVAENYPELKATQNFLSLQDQLEGTQNRIVNARRDFIDSTKEYNVAIRRFPASLFAGLFGFAPKPQLEVPEAALEVPKVEFDFGADKKE